MSGYTDTILKYASDTTHVGILEKPDGTGEVGLSGNEIGRRLAVRFTLSMSNENVEAIRFQVFGCGFTIAACAAGAEIAEGLPLRDIASIDAWAISNRLKGLPDERSYCADIAAEALQAAAVSAATHSQTIMAHVSPDTEEHEAPISPEDPLYLHLLDASVGSELPDADRQMFAALLAITSRESQPLHETLGLDETSLAELLETYFPNIDKSRLCSAANKKSKVPEINQDVLLILLSHVPCDATGGMNQTSEWLARILAARAALPGHLWVSMGFFERPQLTKAIRRHLPELAKANNQGMRWKRYLFKQVCDMNGGVMCKSPNCGDCSDYALCFVSG